MMYYPTNLLLDLFDLLKFLFRNFASMYMRFLQIFFCNAFGYGTYMYIKSEFCRGQRIKPGSYASNYVLIALLAARILKFGVSPVKAANFLTKICQISFIFLPQKMTFNLSFSKVEFFLETIIKKKSTGFLRTFLSIQAPIKFSSLHSKVIY